MKKRSREKMKDIRIGPSQSPRDHILWILTNALNNETVCPNVTNDYAGDCHRPRAHQSHDRITILL
jgi:hypothetical protein